MQLTHPAFLILELPARDRRKSLAKIAETSRTSDGDLELSGFERDFFPIYPASAKVQSWDIYACVRQVLDVLDPIPKMLPESFVREHNLISEDEALRAIHLAESAAERERARRAPDVRRGARAAVGAGGAQEQRARRVGSGRAEDGRRSARGAHGAVAVRADGRSTRSARDAVGRARRHPADEPDAAGRGRFGKDHRLGAGHAADGRRRATNARCSRRRKSLPPNMPARCAMSSVRWRWPASSAVPRTRRGWRC